MSIAAVGLLAPGADAFAGYQSGPYLGETEQDEEIRFRAGDWQVRKLSAVVYADCKDGRRQRITIESGRTAIEDDRFELKLTGPSDLEVRVIGKLEGGDAVGRIEASMRSSGTPCAADLRWRAERL